MMCVIDDGCRWKEVVDEGHAGDYYLFRGYLGDRDVDYG
jgi:hypothetical protein